MVEGAPGMFEAVPAELHPMLPVPGYGIDSHPAGGGCWHRSSAVPAASQAEMTRSPCASHDSVDWAMHVRKSLASESQCCCCASASCWLQSGSHLGSGEVVEEQCACACAACVHASLHVAGLTDPEQPPTAQRSAKARLVDIARSIPPRVRAVRSQIQTGILAAPVNVRRRAPRRPTAAAAPRWSTPAPAWNRWADCRTPHRRGPP